MAEKKSTTKTTKKTTTTKTVWSLSKIAMYTLCAVAVLYLLGLVFSLCNFSGASTIARALQGVGTAIMICIVSVLAWRYVSKKQAVWKVLYVVCLLVVLVGIVIPLVK